MQSARSLFYYEFCLWRPSVPLFAEWTANLKKSHSPQKNDMEGKQTADVFVTLLKLDSGKQRLHLLFEARYNF
jgi:hypothetical protein